MYSEDVLREIISRLPLNIVVQCKLVSRDIKSMISGSDFAKILFQRQKDTSTQLIYTRTDASSTKKFHKISLDPITQSMTIIPHEVEILASCNGLILIDFERVGCYSVFNPITRDRQLISYPEAPPYGAERIGLAVDYPNSDQYKLVAISNLVENSNLFYRLHILSSQQPGLWREIQLRTNAFLSLSVESPPVYRDGSLYWLREDGSVIAFDTRTEEAILIDRPEFLDHYDLTYGKITIGQGMWLGTAQGLLTLVCIFRSCIVTAAYNTASRRWTVSYPVDNFFIVQEDNVNGVPIWILNGFPVWIDSKPVSFLVQRHLTLDYDLYEYDTNVHVYENVALLHRADSPMYCFHPTLASVHRTPFNNITPEDEEHIAENLHDIRRFIIEGIIIEEESSSEESSSSSSGEEEEEEEEEAGGEEAEEADAGGEEADAGGEEADAGGEEAEAGGEEEMM